MKTHIATAILTAVITLLVGLAFAYRITPGEVHTNVPGYHGSPVRLSAQVWASALVVTQGEFTLYYRNKDITNTPDWIVWSGAVYYSPFGAYTEWLDCRNYYKDSVEALTNGPAQFPEHFIKYLRTESNACVLVYDKGRAVMRTNWWETRAIVCCQVWYTNAVYEPYVFGEWFLGRIRYEWYPTEKMGISTEGR